MSLFGPRFENEPLWATLWKYATLIHALKVSHFEPRFENELFWATRWKCATLTHALKNGCPGSQVVSPKDPQGRVPMSTSPKINQPEPVLNPSSYSEFIVPHWVTLGYTFSFRIKWPRLASIDQFLPQFQARHDKIHHTHDFYHQTHSNFAWDAKNFPQMSQAPHLRRPVSKSASQQVNQSTSQQVNQSASILGHRALASHL